MKTVLDRILRPKQMLVDLKGKQAFFGKLLVAFFILMILLTVISRAADSVIIPKVMTGSKESGSLTLLLTGQGTVKTSDETFIPLPEDFRVETCVKTGTKVESGQMLVSFLMSDLEDKKKEMETQLKKLDLSLKSAGLNAKPPASVPQQESASRSLNRAQNKYNEAQGELQKAQDDYDTVSAVMAEEYRVAAAATEEKLKLALPEIYEQAKEEYDKTMSALDAEYNSAIAEMEAELHMVLEDVKTQEDQLNLAQDAMDLAAMGDAGTEANEQKDKTLSGYTQETIKLDMELLKDDLLKVEKLIENEGEVRSEWAGTVTEMGVKAGVVTSGAELVRIGTGGYVFSAAIARKDAALLSPGDEITIIQAGEARGQSMKIEEIILNPSGQGGGDSAGTGTGLSAEDASSLKESAEISARLEGEAYTAGETAGFEISKKSEESYNCLIPIEALREDSKGKYCLVVEKRNTIMGDEEIAVRIPLSLIKSDAAKAAVEDALSLESQIIIESNKIVSEGDRVRSQ